MDEVINIIYKVMGNNPHKHNTSSGQISYNCPKCDNNRNKGKLEINYKKLVMKCWSCCNEDNGVHGSLLKLIKMEGTNKDVSNYIKATKDFVYENSPHRVHDYKPNIFLPKEYVKITPKDIQPSMKWAYLYVKNRGISDEQIEEYSIGFCGSGDYSGRIIIPSYDKYGDLNFFVGRTYTGNKNKYKNPEILKNEIICNEQNVNWDGTVYLVEGMLDYIGLGIKNTIPMLGKIMSPKLLEEILSKSKGDIIIALDPDAKTSAYKIYNELNSYYHMDGRVHIIELPLDLDWSKIRELYGNRGIIKCLKRVKNLDILDLKLVL